MFHSLSKQNRFQFSLHTTFSMRMVSSRFVLFLLFTRWNPCFLFIRWRNFVHFNYQKDSSSFTLEAAWASKQFLQNKQEEVDSTFSLREKRPKGVCNIFCGPIFAKLCAEKKSIFLKVSPKCSPWKAVLFRDEISDFYLGPLDKYFLFICLGKLFSKVLLLQMVRKKKKTLIDTQI